MSKGLSKIQQTIMNILTGKERGLVYSNAAGTLTTGELLAELDEREMVNRKVSRKIQLFTVRRACDSLQIRGLLKSKYESDWDANGAKTVSWSLPEEK